MSTGFKKVRCTECARRLFDVYVENVNVEMVSDCIVMIKCDRCKEVMLINLTDGQVIDREL